jgi:hypothetical protein
MKFKMEQANDTYKFLTDKMEEDVKKIEKQWRRENPKGVESTLIMAMSHFRFERLQTIINTAEGVDIKERTLAGGIAMACLEENTKKE